MYNRTLNLQEAEIIAEYLESLKPTEDDECMFSVMNNRIYIPAKNQNPEDTEEKRKEKDEGFFSRKAHFGAHFNVQYWHYETLCKSFKKFTTREYYYRAKVQSSDDMAKLIQKSSKHGFTHYTGSGENYFGIRKDLINYWAKGNPSDNHYVIANDTNGAVWRVTMKHILDLYNSRNYVECNNNEDNVVCYFGLNDAPDFVSMNRNNNGLAMKIATTWKYIGMFGYAPHRAKSKGVDIIVTNKDGTKAAQWHCISLNEAFDMKLDPMGVEVKRETVKKALTRKGLYTGKVESRGWVFTITKTENIESAGVDTEEAVEEPKIVIDNIPDNTSKSITRRIVTVTEEKKTALLDFFNDWHYELHPDLIVKYGSGYYGYMAYRKDNRESA